MNDGWGGEGGGTETRLLTDDEAGEEMGKDEKMER